MAHVTDLGFTMLELGKAKDEGLIRSQVHPEFPTLEIFNYTEEVQFKKKWNRITLACRGLILDTVTGDVIARPWDKFFNFAERDLEIDFNGPVEVTDKMDGSLGILYRRPDGDCAIATRGSFASEQAIHATELWKNEYEMYHDFNDLIDEFTFLFEIVYPENRIVVNYGDMDDLVLLGAVHKERGYYCGPSEASAMLGWMGPTTETFNYATFGDAISAPDRPGKEGYVIRSGSKMVKLKQYDYVELHRIVTNLNPRTIWQMLGDGKTISQIVDGLPDEFHSYVERIGNELFQQAADIEYRIKSGFLQSEMTYHDKYGYDLDRGKYARLISKEPDKGYYFSLLDGRDIRDSIWKSIKPKVDKSLVDNADDAV